MLQNYPFANIGFDSDNKLGWKDARYTDVFRGVSLSIEDDGVEEAQAPNPNDMAPPIAPF